MAYCTLAEITELNPKRVYSSTTKPTAEQVQNLITRVAGEMDSALRNQGYGVPITSPDEAVDYLKYMNALGAAAKAEAGMFPESSGPASTGRAQSLQSEYNRKLRDLRKDGLEGISKSSNLPSSYSVDNETDDHLTPNVDKDTQF